MRGAPAGLGQEESVGQAPGPDRAVGFACLGPDDVADRAREALDGGLGRVPAQAEQQDGCRAAVAGVASGLVTQRRDPVLAGVEDERSTLTSGGARRAGALREAGPSRNASMWPAVR